MIRRSLLLERKIRAKRVKTSVPGVSLPLEQITQWNPDHIFPAQAFGQGKGSWRWFTERNTLILDALPALYDLLAFAKAMPDDVNSRAFKSRFKKLLDMMRDGRLKEWAAQLKKLKRDVFDDIRELERRGVLDDDQEKQFSKRAMDAANAFFAFADPTWKIQSLPGMADNWAETAEKWKKLRTSSKRFNAGLSSSFPGLPGMKEHILDMLGRLIRGVDEGVGALAQLLNDITLAAKQGLPRARAKIKSETPQQTLVAKIGSWRVLVLDDPKRESWSKQTVERFRRAAAEAWKRLKALRIDDRYLSGDIVLAPERSKKWAGFFSPGGGSADGLGGNVAAIESEPPGSRLSSKWMVEVIVHEVGHRLWYQGLGNRGRRVFSDFIEGLGKPFTEQEVWGILGHLAFQDDRIFDYLSQDKGLLKTQIDKWRNSLPLSKRYIADLLWKRVGTWGRGMDPVEFHLWLTKKRYTKMLPSEYANTTPVEAWPEVIVDLAMGGMARRSSDLVLGVVHQAMGGLREDVERFQSLMETTIEATKVKIRVRESQGGAVLKATAYAGRQKVGHVVAWGALRDFKMAKAYVEKDYRGKGIGKRLYQALADAACDRGKPLLSQGYQRSPHASWAWASLEKAGVATKDGRDYRIPCTHAH